MAPELLLPFRFLASKNLCYRDRFFLANTVAQPLCGRGPYVVTLEIDAENIVVRGGRLNCDLLHIAFRVAYEHLWLMRVESGAIDRPVRAVVIGESLVRGEPGAIRVNALDLIEEVAGQAAIFGEKVVPVTSVVAASAEVGRNPENLVDVADRGGDLVDQALIFHHDHLSFAVRVLVILPALGLLVVFEDASAPYGVVDLIYGSTDSVVPDFVHRRIALIEKRPLSGACVEAARTSGGGGPDIVALHADAVDYVVAQADRKRTRLN